jgi:hypothetical protein
LPTAYSESAKSEPSVRAAAASPLTHVVEIGEPATTPVLSKLGGAIRPETGESTAGGPAAAHRTGAITRRFEVKLADAAPAAARHAGAVPRSLTP